MMVGMTVVIETDPSWLDYLIAIGTVGAAAFAAYAALVSRRAAAAAIDLVRVESGRDTRAADEAMWRQARRVAVDMRATPVPHPSPHELVVELGIWNTSADPMLKCRAGSRSRPAARHGAATGLNDRAGREGRPNSRRRWSTGCRREEERFSNGSRRASSSRRRC
jgi:hypothetical protein